MDRAWLKGTQKAHRSPISVNLICLNLCVLFSLFFSFSFFSREREEEEKKQCPKFVVVVGSTWATKQVSLGSLYIYRSRLVLVALLSPSLPVMSRAVLVCCLPGDNSPLEGGGRV